MEQSTEELSVSAAMKQLKRFVCDRQFAPVSMIAIKKWHLEHTKTCHQLYLTSPTIDTDKTNQSIEMMQRNCFQTRTIANSS